MPSYHRLTLGEPFTLSAKTVAVDAGLPSAAGGYTFKAQSFRYPLPEWATATPGPFIYDGTLTGTPTAAGFYRLGVQGYSGAGSTAAWYYYPLRVVDPAAPPAPLRLPIGAAVTFAPDDAAEAAGLFPADWTRAWSWAADAAAAVPGLAFDTLKALAGTPTTAGEYPLALVQVDSRNTVLSSQPVTVTVYDPTPPPPPPPEPEPEPEPEPTPGTDPEPVDDDGAAQTVARFIGQPGNAAVVALAAEHLRVVRSFVRAYTRGRGFTGGAPTAELSDVITSMTARNMVNPTGARQEGIGGHQVTYASIDGFTLAELSVLNLYRRRSA